MSSLLVPELHRYLTRRTTWISGIAAVSLLAIVSLFMGLQPNSYNPEIELSFFGPGMIVLAAALVGAWSYFTSASVIGSEQSSGALGTWLTFNPQRWRVYLAKLASVALPAAAVSTVAMGAAIAWSLIVSTHSHPSAVAWMLAAGVRGVLVVVSVAVLGFVIALVTRSTLGALGVLVGWLVLVVLQAFFSTVAIGHWEWIGLERVLGEFLLNSHSTVHGALHADPAVIAGAGLLWFGVIALVVVLGGALFAGRDVD